MAKTRNGEKDKARRALWLAERRLAQARAEGATQKRLDRLQGNVNRLLRRYRDAVTTQELKG